MTLCNGLGCQLRTYHLTLGTTLLMPTYRLHLQGDSLLDNLQFNFPDNIPYLDHIVLCSQMQNVYRFLFGKQLPKALHKYTPL